MDGIIIDKPSTIEPSRTHLNFETNSWLVPVYFSGALAKLRNSTISFVTSVCPSVRPQGITGIQLDEFL